MSPVSTQTSSSINKITLEALVIIMPNPDLVTLSYSEFANAVSQVNTTLANAYEYTCDNKIKSLYINNDIYKNTIYLLNANGIYEIPDSNWKPDYLNITSCPSTIIRLWFDINNIQLRRLQNISRKLNSIAHEKELEITNNIRWNVVPLLQTGQYDIEIWLNGYKTLAETVKVINTEEQLNSENSAIQTPNNIETTASIGGISGGLLFVLAVGLIIILRKRINKKNEILNNKKDIQTNNVLINPDVNKRLSLAKNLTTYNQISLNNKKINRDQISSVQFYNKNDLSSITRKPNNINKERDANYKLVKNINKIIDPINDKKEYFPAQPIRPSETKIKKQFPAQQARPLDKNINNNQNGSIEFIQSVEKININTPYFNQTNIKQGKIIRVSSETPK